MCSAVPCIALSKPCGDCIKFGPQHKCEETKPENDFSADDAILRGVFRLNIMVLPKVFVESAS